LPDGSVRHLQDEVKLIQDPVTGRRKVAGNIRDITERKLAEQALRESEERYRLISTVASDFMFSVIRDPQGNFSRQWIGGAFEQITEYSIPEYFARGGWRAILHPDDLAQDDAMHARLLTNQPATAEVRIVTKTGSIVWVRVFEHPIWDSSQQQLTGVYGGVQDITERKLAEAALRESEARLKSIIESAMDAIITVDEASDIVLFNAAAERLFRFPASRAIGEPLSRFIPERFRQAHTEHLRNFATNPTFAHGHLSTRPVLGLRADGTEFRLESSTSQVETAQGKLFTVILRDISARLHAEQEIRYQANLLANVSEAIISTDAQLRVTSWNNAAERIYGWKAADMLGRPLNQVISIDYLDSTFVQVLKDFEQTGSWSGVTRQGTADGTTRYIASSVTLLRDETGEPEGTVTVNRDISSSIQQQHELEAIVTVSSALRTATLDTDILAIVLEQVKRLLSARAVAFARLAPATGEITMQAILGEINTALFERIPESHALSTEVLKTGLPYLNNNLLDPSTGLTADTVGDLRAAACVPFIAQQHPLGALWLAGAQTISESEMRILVAVADIAANAMYRAQLYANAETQLTRIETLHTIDTAIASSLDLNLTLNLLVEQVTTRLKIDAAAVLLFNPALLNLEHAASRGFHLPPERASLRLGEGLAGHVALQHEIINLPDLKARLKREPSPSLFNLYAESFVAYCGIPLLMKGTVKGVLELYGRSPLPSDLEWTEYVKTLAQQAAIAVDNLELYNNLQRSNLELGLAYDATIEGWSRALDLRDRETEGHTLRVTELTARLARSFGLSDPEIVNLRRGALLHDIGKMGVPDSILLKPDRLTADEWTIMRQHPVHAYAMLSPIAYLRPALDIPYFHHEKWDGTGYPTGRAGEQIPLAARLFAVVDVWDALTSDRPYRSAWTPECARAHILAERGKHFDPQIVDRFFQLLDSTEFSA
jgi:PAS domain S-box-containing protein/putative nucleotidyltransferase with HDIG domain